MASPQSQAKDFICSPKQFRKWATAVFDARDSSREFVARTLNGKKIKGFNVDRYIEAKEELSLLDTLPPIPERKTFEQHLAWLEEAESRAMATSADQRLVRSLPTIKDVMTIGNQRQQRALAKWSKRYGPMFEKKFSRRQLERATADLTLILHDSKFDIAMLARHGVKDSSIDYVLTQTHAKTLENGLLSVFGEDLIRKDQMLDQVKNLLEKNPVKWPVNAAVNTGFFLSSKYIFSGVLVTLPRHQIARITAEDMALILTEGWAKHGTAMAAKYAPQVKKQIFYNSAKNIFGDLSYLSTAYIATEFIRNHYGYEDKIDQKKHRTDVVKPVVE
jgi:hypothetical protein